MKRRSSVPVKVARKAPKQARSRQLAADLLEGATRVLASEGAAGFTTNRVADATGVSIGSLYQYYPNKESLLLDLHQRDAERLWAELEQVLCDDSKSPKVRFEGVIVRSFEAQLAAAEHHTALREASAVLHEPGFQEFAAHVEARLEAFLQSALPERSTECAFLARFCFTVVTATLERIATEPKSSDDVSRIARETATMLSAHLCL